MADWWPFGGHSLFEDRASGVEFEPRVGGAVEEVSVDGERGRWGTLTAWDPPRRFVMTWHPGRPVETAQELEVRFVPDGAGTIVELEHRGWEKLLERADEAQQGYSGGWGKVLEGYVVECERSGS
jgi:uncharacterized protein YndB with AHSA1/START domain